MTWEGLLSWNYPGWVGGWALSIDTVIAEVRVWPLRPRPNIAFFNCDKTHIAKLREQVLFVSSFYRWDYRGLERLRHVLQDNQAGGGRGVRPHNSVWSASEPVTLYLSHLPYLTIVTFELLPCFQTFTISILTCIKIISWPDFSFEWTVCGI